MAHGRGSNRGANRGGHRGNGRGGFRGRGRGRGNPTEDYSDFTIYDWMNNAPRGSASNGANAPKYRGRGRGGGSGSSTPRGGTPRGGFATPNRGSNGFRGRGRPRYNTLVDMDDPDPGMGRGRGRGSPIDRGRGRGAKHLAAKLKAGAPLSKLLYEDRPLLRPIVFVRSVYTATLFQEEEEILQPLAEDTTNNEASHVPTASQVNRVFGTVDDYHAEEDEQLEEIDFSDIGRVQAEVDAAAAQLRETTVTEVTTEVTTVEEQFTGFYIDTEPAPVKNAAPKRDRRHILGDDDEIIVYVAPHPRAGPVTPPSVSQVLPTTSILTGLAPQAPAEEATATQAPSESIVDSVMDEATPEAPQPGDSGDIPDEHLVAAAPLPGSAPLPPDSTPSLPESALSLTESGVLPEALMQQAHALSIETLPTTEAESVGEVAQTEAAPASDAAPAAEAHLSASVPEESVDAPVVEVSAEAGPSTQPVAAEDFTFSFKATTEKKTYTRKLHPARTPRSLIKRGVRTRRKPLRGFSSFGASLAEAQLRGEDPRHAERRIGDSDVEWGSDDGDIEELSNGVGDMTVDDDIDLDAMKRFVKGMGPEGSRTVTMDDVADELQMRLEDDEDEQRGEESAEASAEDSNEEDSELEEVVRKEEELMVAESTEIGLEEGDDDEHDEDDEDEDDNDSDDDEFDSPRRGFQARLQRIRERASKDKGKAKATGPPESDDDEDDEDLGMNLEQSWADDDEDFIAHIQELADEGQDILSRKARKQQNRLFRSIRNGDIDHDEYEELMGRPAKPNKDKYKDLPDELQAQWEADRAKKAENKRKRAQARLEAAADPLSKKKGGKKGMKAMLAAARYEGEEELPNRIVDLVSLEQQIRRFLANIGGPRTMNTPPADKEIRKKIHEMANAFNLKSHSEGNGNTRYTILTKTTMSGTYVNERKIRRILKVPGHWDTTGSSRSGKAKAISLAKHREGEEVGKAAPKISENNIGFRMLASMGWAEGERIGLSGGLEAPLTAKMKKTKLGLGATPMS